MKKRKRLAIILGVLGIMGMFFFPSPEVNFLYYLGFVFIVITLIIFLLKSKSKKRK